MEHRIETGRTDERALTRVSRDLYSLLQILHWIKVTSGGPCRWEH